MLMGSDRGSASFFNAHNDFFEEIAKYRAARKIWAQVMRERFGGQESPYMADAIPYADCRRIAAGAATDE